MSVKILTDPGNKARKEDLMQMVRQMTWFLSSCEQMDSRRIEYVGVLIRN